MEKILSIFSIALLLFGCNGGLSETETIILKELEINLECQVESFKGTVVNSNNTFWELTVTPNHPFTKKMTAGGYLSRFSYFFTDFSEQTNSPYPEELTINVMLSTGEQISQTYSKNVLEKISEYKAKIASDMTTLEISNFETFFENSTFSDEQIENLTNHLLQLESELGAISNVTLFGWNYQLKADSDNTPIYQMQYAVKRENQTSLTNVIYMQKNDTIRMVKIEI